MADALRRVEELRREIEYLRRELVHLPQVPQSKPSLFGSVPGEDIPEEEIEKAKKSLFRELVDI